MFLCFRNIDVKTSQKAEVKKHKALTTETQRSQRKKQKKIG